MVSVKKRLVVLLGVDFEERLIKGLVRNGFSVLWHREGYIRLSIRNNFSGIDWVCSSKNKEYWIEKMGHFEAYQKDRWIIVTESSEAVFEDVYFNQVKIGYIPQPISLRQLIKMLYLQENVASEMMAKLSKVLFAENQLMENAKQVIMTSKKCTEPEAYKHLRRLSMDRCKPIEEVAKHILNQ